RPFGHGRPQRAPQRDPGGHRSLRISPRLRPRRVRRGTVRGGDDPARRGRPGDARRRLHLAHRPRAPGMSLLAADARAFVAAARKELRMWRRYPLFILGLLFWPIVLPATWVLMGQAYSGGGDARALAAFAERAGTTEFAGFVFVGYAMYMWLSNLLWGPGTAQAGAALLPPTYIVADIRTVLFRGVGLGGIAIDLVLLLAFAGLITLLAVWVFRILETSARRRGTLGSY